MTTLLVTLRRHWIPGMLGLLALVGSTCFAGAPAPDQAPAASVTTTAGDAVAADEVAGAPSLSTRAARRPAPGRAADPDTRTGAVSQHAPDPTPTPVPAASPSPVPEEVDEHRADLVVRPDHDAADIREASGVEGVEHLAAVAEFRADTPNRKGKPFELSVLAVDATTFRGMTPPVTAQEPGVWQRLSEGDVLLRHDVADRLGVELGSRIRLDTDLGTLPVRVGAFASNGAPPFADLVVPWEVATLLGEHDATTLLVAVGDDAKVATVGERVLETVGGGNLERRELPETRRASAERAAPSGAERLRASGSTGTIEPFSYTDLGDGMIAIDPAWVSRWIAPVEIPGMGVTRCHRVMIPQLLGALEELQERGLYRDLDPAQFGGCWVPRHIDFDPSDPISNHAWGLAIDFNVQTNGLGQTPTMDLRVVRVFERWGFEWGGWWSRPDGMHFELDRVLTP